MKTLFTLSIILISLSAFAQKKTDSEIKSYLTPLFEKALSSQLLFIDKIGHTKIDNAKLIQAGINFCSETGKCNAVMSDYSRQIYSDELAVLDTKDIALKATLFVVKRK